jgi:hypothetical protein
METLFGIDASDVRCRKCFLRRRYDLVILFSTSFALSLGSTSWTIRGLRAEAIPAVTASVGFPAPNQGTVVRNLDGADLLLVEFSLVVVEVDVPVLAISSICLLPTLCHEAAACSRS